LSSVAAARRSDPWGPHDGDGGSSRGVPRDRDLPLRPAAQRAPEAFTRRRLLPLPPYAPVAASSVRRSISVLNWPDWFPLVLLRAARPAALAARAGPARRLDVTAAAAAGHQKLMGSLTSNEKLRFGVVSRALLFVEKNMYLCYIIDGHR